MPLPKQKDVYKRQDVGEREEAILAGEAGEIRVYECAGDLSCAVRAEVEEHDGIAGCDRSAALDDARHDELVRDFVFIGFRYSANRARELFALSLIHILCPRRRFTPDVLLAV